tara:strand:+ start:973 stop:1155 length:183 start_codon:yes stop_codon:yes gene_type:complete
MPKAKNNLEKPKFNPNLKENIFSGKNTKIMNAIIEAKLGLVFANIIKAFDHSNSSLNPGQ